MDSKDEIKINKELLKENIQNTNNENNKIKDKFLKIHGQKYQTLFLKRK